jgi:hypothetical protein
MFDVLKAQLTDAPTLIYDSDGILKTKTILIDAITYDISHETRKAPVFTVQ